MKNILCLLSVFLVTQMGCGQTPKPSKEMVFKVEKTEDEWKALLSPEQYRVLREKGTERPYSGELYYENNDGLYRCAACDFPLFTSETKFDAHCGWPSFYAPHSPNAVVEKKDLSHGMVRTEILCGNCGGHLGHVFDDGPNPTGLRYCINSVSLDFSPSNLPTGQGNKVE